VLFAAVQTQLLSLAPPGDSHILRALKIFAFMGIICNLGATAAYVTWGRTMAWTKAIATLSENIDPQASALVPHARVPVKLSLRRVFWFAFMLEFVAYCTSMAGSAFLLAHFSLHVWAVESTLIAGMITPFISAGIVALVIFSSEIILRVAHGVFVVDVLRMQEKLQLSSCK
jgi:hypothetical protein